VGIPLIDSPSSRASSAISWSEGSLPPSTPILQVEQSWFGPHSNVTDWGASSGLFQCSGFPATPCCGASVWGDTNAAPTSRAICECWGAEWDQVCAFCAPPGPRINPDIPAMSKLVNQPLWRFSLIMADTRTFDSYAGSPHASTPCVPL
jgi:hypothetical protein